MIHWGMVLGFVLNRFVLVPGSLLHRWVGSALVLMVLIRLVWGMTSAKRAEQLSSLIPWPHLLRAHIDDLIVRRYPRELHHNPLGSIGIGLIWIVFLLLGLTGWGQSIDALLAYPLDEWHAFLVFCLTWLVVIHIVAVVIVSWWVRRNLLRAMLPSFSSFKIKR